MLNEPEMRHMPHTQYAHLLSAYYTTYPVCCCCSACKLVRISQFSPGTDAAVWQRDTHVPAL